MTERENFIRAYCFEEPDWIPGGVGVRADGWHKYGEALNDLYEKYFGYRPYTADKIPHPDPQFIKNDEYHRTWTDEWGCTMEERIFGIHPMIVGHPLADWAALRTYQPPAGPDTSPETVERERKQIAESKKTNFVIHHFLRLFERMQWLRGYAQLMLDFAEDPPELHRMADLIVEHNLKFIRHSIDVGADGIGFSDDWGTQNALMIHPRRWREFFAPRYRCMFQPALDAGLMIHFHSDGYIMDIIPDLRELGVSVLNLQTNCHDLAALGRLGREIRLCLSTDMDRQGSLSFGTPEDVKDYTRRVVQTVGGPDGGLVLSYECGSDTPLENIEAAMQAYQEWRDYPRRKRTGN